MSQKQNFTSSSLSSAKKKNNSKSNYTFLKILLGIIWVVVVFFLSVSMTSWFKGFFDQVKNVAISSISKTVWDPMKKDQYNSVNVLLLWYWWETHQWWFLTDSIMVASWNPDENNVTLFSVPRDLYVKSPVNSSYWRINAIFQQYYSRTKSIEESALWLAWKLEEILWLSIPYYATIDFQAFKEIVDAIWWVDLYVVETIDDKKYPADNMIDYDPFYIEAWWQHLDWDTALKYARSRHTTSDFARSLRQQELIIAIKDKILASWLNVSTAGSLYEQYKSYIQTNISLQEMLRTVQYLPKIKGFSSFGYTSTCSYQNVSRMTPWCFLYNPPLADFNWMAVLLPDWATYRNIDYYDEMKTFVTFLLTHRAFLSEKASVEVVNGIDSSVLKSNWFGKASVATRLWAKLAKYWLNVTNVTNWDTTETSYIMINMVWDFTWTIDAIQTFLPIQDIRVDTWSVQEDHDEYWNIEYWTNRAYISVVLWNDYILWSDSFSWLVDEKFSYVLDIKPILPVLEKVDNTEDIE